MADTAKTSHFDERTRSQALEIVLTLAEMVPAAIRKVPEIKTDLFPAVFSLIATCEEDEAAWNESAEEELGTGSDAYSVGISGLERLSSQMKEKLTLEACSPLIGECLQQSQWQAVQAGYIASGLIAHSCPEYMKANIQTALQTACAGVQHQSPRVKYASLFNLAQLLITLKPTA